MDAEPLPVLPPALRVEAWENETVFSLAARLERDLKATRGAIRSLAYGNATRGKGRRGSRDETVSAMEALCESMCCLPSGVLAAPTSNLQMASHACPDCSAGQTIEYVWDGRGFTCPEHRRWIAPAPTERRPGAYEPHPPGPHYLRRLSVPVVVADCLIRSLISAGRVSQPLLAEAQRRVASALKGTRAAEVIRPEQLPALADLLAIVTAPRVHAVLLDEGRTFAERRSWMDRYALDLAPACRGDLQDEAWLLLRPSVVWHRIAHLGEKPAEPLTPLIRMVTSQPSAHFPLEPMRRYLDCLEPSGRSGDAWWCDRFQLPGERLLFLCPAGHCLRSSKGQCRRNPQESFHCSVCSGQRVISGLDSLGDVMPRFIREWDPVNNGTMTPFTVSPGSDRTAAWICPFGHPYRAAVSSRTHQGSGCRFCAGKEIRPGSTDFATTHPHLAALFDDEANWDVRATDVTAGNARLRIHFRCPEGHSFVRTVAKLVKSDGRCPVCRGTVLVPGVNDLATTRPDIAAWWHPARNGDITTEMVRSQSAKKYWWICPQGHEFEQGLAARARRAAPVCLVETGQVLFEGLNDLATLEPRLSEDWDEVLNGCAAHGVVRGKAARWWTCKWGHTQLASVCHRRRSGGCTMCLPEDRVMNEAIVRNAPQNTVSGTPSNMRTRLTERQESAASPQ